MNSTAGDAGRVGMHAANISMQAAAARQKERTIRFAFATTGVPGAATGNVVFGH